MSFEEMLKEKNLKKDYMKYKQSGVVTYKLECAVTEILLDDGDMNMWLELNNNGEPSELITNYLSNLE
tara:strand:+ start:8087 stop:8290 length:204 start_codon:yes stop_codon:yes gene_type:complete